MDKRELERRTRTFAVEVIRLVETFPRSPAGRVVATQLLKSATSIGANYREANRSRSRREFAHKIGIAEKEGSETEYWLEICADAGVGEPNLLGELRAEAGELLAIFTSIGRSMRENDARSTASQSRASQPEASHYGIAVDDHRTAQAVSLIPVFDEDDD